MALHHHRSRKCLRAAAALAMVGTVLAGCSGSSSHGNGSVLSLAPGPGAPGPFSRNFNPLSPTVGEDGSSFFPIFEPLMMNDPLTNKSKPWLAKSYKWSADGRGITFKLRSDVKWSDGKPFTASDVAYTFNLIKKNPGLNGAGLPLSSASAPDSSTVVVNFATPAYVDIVGIMNTRPVPEHTYSKVKNPTTYADPNPIGTGPYLLKSFTPHVITLTKNPGYWQGGKPSINELRYIAYNTPGSMLAAMESGEIQWASQEFYAGVQPFLKRDPTHNEQVSFGLGLYPEYVNFTAYPLNQLPVRKAISEALDRLKMAKLAFPNLDQPPLSPTGLDAKANKDLICPQFSNLRYKPDPAAAKKTLTDAGYTMGSNGYFVSPKGSPLKFQIIMGNGGPGQVSAAQEEAQELKQVGIGLSVKLVSGPTLAAYRAQGKFQIDNGGIPPLSTADPFPIYNYLMNFPESAPIGKPAALDRARFNDPKAVRLLNQYASAAPGSHARTTALCGLEQIMVTQIPALPLFINAGRSAYSDKDFTGWPTKSNPYLTAPVAWLNTAEVVLLHLKPR